MKQYSTGRIYKIYNTEEPSQFYIGSTTQQLCKRMANHRNNAKSQISPGSKLYNYANQVGWGALRIELIEAFDKEMTLEELHKIEGNYIRELKPPLNIKVEGRTEAEIKEIRAGDVPCEICGKKINYTNISHHNKTKKHLRKAEKINENNENKETLKI